MESSAEKFSAPIEVNDVNIAFGGDIKKLLPDYEDIPEEFKQSSNKWNKFVSKWFFEGIDKDAEFYPKEGVDIKKAFRHLKAVMVSWAPKHEHKTAGVAYLMSLWFTDFELPERKS